jgi:VWFA-related protein
MRVVWTGVIAGALIAACGTSWAELKDRSVVETSRLAAQGTGTPTIQVYSREVVVDVEVLDAKGQPVHGLTQADFTVKENNKEQAVRSFAEYSDGVMTAGQAPLAPALPDGVYANYQKTPITGPVNVLVLDALNAGPGLVAFERRETVRYLQMMPEGTQVAIFWLSQGGLHLLQGFTQDRRLLIGAVSRSLGGTVAMEEWTRQWLTVDAMDEIAMYVSPVKGRKNLLWFTPGMPVNLTRDGGYGEHDGDMGRVHRLMDAYELLSRSQVAICPIDPRGVGPMMNGATLSAEAVAQESGGTAVYNTNALAEGMGKAIERGSSYYTLSYVPPGRKDDVRYHHISVEVNRPGVHLVYRKGYNAEDPLARNAVAPGPGLMKAVTMGRAMTMGRERNGAELMFDVQVLPSTDGNENKATVMQSAVRPAGKRHALPIVPSGPSMMYSFSYSVPVDQIAFSMGAGGRRTASLEFDSAAYGRNGTLVSIRSQRVNIALSPEQYEEFVKTPFQYTQQIGVPMGQAMVRAWILDDVSKKAGTMEIPVTVRAAVAER